ncbi:GTP-binding protein rbg1 [Marasmius tenuissimus]|nr:GTP-binding protein rbg1 [Marasmius tenuissimus]
MSVPISSKEWLNVDELIDVMWKTLDLVRVYTKPRGLAPDYSSPVVLRRGKCTIEDFCMSIHKEIAKQMKYAVVWGASAKHTRGQKVGLDHVLEDEDGRFVDLELYELDGLIVCQWCISRRSNISMYVYVLVCQYQHCALRCHYRVPRSPN